MPEFAGATNKYAVIFACDHNYIWPALTAANMLARTSRIKNFDIRICSTTFIPDGFQEHCAPGVQAEIISMGDFIPKTGVTARHSVSTFACLFAVEQLSEEYERVLYLDADIAICSGNIDLLWSADMLSKPIGAVSDGMVWKKPRRGVRRYMKALGCIPTNGGYFNGGCLLVDCAAWSTGFYYNKISSFLEEYPHLCWFHDQSAFNAVFANNWAEISFLWNWQLALTHNLLLIETRRPSLVHFNTKTKPWYDPYRTLPLHFKQPFIDLSAKRVWARAKLDNMVGRVDNKFEEENIRRLTSLYDTLPEYLESVSGYLDRTDFIDFGDD